MNKSGFINCDNFKQDKKRNEPDKPSDISVKLKKNKKALNFQLPVKKCVHSVNQRNSAALKSDRPNNYSTGWP